MGRRGGDLMAILLFFVVHWQLSVLLHSIFQHRYASHRQFRMTPRAEACLHLLDYLVHQRPSTRHLVSISRNDESH